MTDGTNEQSQEMKKVDEKHASAITGELKSKIDKIWEVFWSNGISNPLSVIEQISYLLFMRQLDTIETRNEKKANLLGMPFKDRIFPEAKANARTRWPCVHEYEAAHHDDPAQRVSDLEPPPLRAHVFEEEGDLREFTVMMSH